ncbi:MAG: NUDIX hydrolase [Rhabdochlamydiaceae bacterium]
MGSHANKQAALELAATIDSRIIYKGAFISVRRDEIDYPNGLHKTWDIVLHPGAVAIIPITQEGHLILVEQWRRAIGKITLELPAGLIEPGEAPEVSAQRELQEEIGKKAETLTYLRPYYSSPGVYTEKIHLFVGKDLIPSPLQGEDTDEIDIQVVSFNQAFKLIEDGTICDAKTALGILLVGRP